MRIRVLRQQFKELIAAAPDHDLAKPDHELEQVKCYLWHGNVFRALQVAEPDHELEQVKCYLWHGNVFRALQVVERIQWQLEDLDEEVPASCKLAKTEVEFQSYITANEAFIPN